MSWAQTFTYEAWAAEYPLLHEAIDEWRDSQFPYCCSGSTAGVLLAPNLLHIEFGPSPNLDTEALTPNFFVKWLNF